jgi:hypothetical protein
MGNRSRSYHKLTGFSTLEEILREKERVRKQQQTRFEQSECTHDGRPSTTGLDDYDPLLEALKDRGHDYAKDPKKDPAKIK